MLKRRLDERSAQLLVVSGAVAGPYSRRKGESPNRGARTMAGKLVEALRRSGTISGPYVWKRGRVTKGRAMALREMICSADDRIRLDPEFLASVTVDDMFRLNELADD